MFTKIYTQVEDISDEFSSSIDLTQNEQDEHENVSFRKKWLDATKNILPTFVGIHAAAFVISCLAILFTQPDFSPKGFPLHTLWQEWNRWDSLHFTRIADLGYSLNRTAFFPLFPSLIRICKVLTHNNSLIAGLLITGVADLVLMVVLYQLTYEEFGKEQARRAVLYLSIFPTAFFFIAAYNEALFLCLTLIAIYLMRHKHWWLAGICGFFVMLTRSVGILLVVPFLYEYLRQHEFQIRKIRFDIISVGLIPFALFIYGCYCYYRYHDFLEFIHSQSAWRRVLVLPGYNLWLALKPVIHSSSLLSFDSLRTMTDAVPDIFIFILLLLAVVGPWRFKRSQMVYVIYGFLVFIYAQIYPVIIPGVLPLEALSRYLLEVFPAFMILGSLGKSRMVSQCYLLVSSAIFFFLLTQFLDNHWVI